MFSAIFVTSSFLGPNNSPRQFVLYLIQHFVHTVLWSSWFLSFFSSFPRSYWYPVPSHAHEFLNFEYTWGLHARTKRALALLKADFSLSCGLSMA